MKKTALITGCAGGIGGATVKKFLENGYRVVGVDVHKECSFSYNRGFVYLPCDLAGAADRAELLQAAGRVHVLVNVAGVAPKVRADLLEMSEESYDFVMGVNTKGTLFLTQAVARQMVEQPEGCAIVNISSMSAYTSSVNRGEYCISKAGVSMITRLFADRLAPYNIPVNEVCPGIIRTGMTKTVGAKYDALIEGGLLPLKRWGEPEDVASAVFALADGALPYVTGQSIHVDGGFHMHRL